MRSRVALAAILVGALAAAGLAGDPPAAEQGEAVLTISVPGMT